MINMLTTAVLLSSISTLNVSTLNNYYVDPIEYEAEYSDFASISTTYKNYGNSEVISNGDYGFTLTKKTKFANNYLRQIKFNTPFCLPYESLSGIEDFYNSPLGNLNYSSTIEQDLEITFEESIFSGEYMKDRIGVNIDFAGKLFDIGASENIELSSKLETEVKKTTKVSKKIINHVSSTRNITIPGYYQAQRRAMFDCYMLQEVTKSKIFNKGQYTGLDKTFLIKTSFVFVFKDNPNIVGCYKYCFDQYNDSFVLDQNYIREKNMIFL